MLTVVGKSIRRIADRYGSKSGWLRYHFFSYLCRLGGLRAYKKIDWQRVTRLVFVCTGNICRSPYAEARTRHLGVPTVSFGLEADGKSPANSEAIRTARRRGLGLDQHVSRVAGDIAIGRGDLLIGMEPRHARVLQKMAKDNGAQTTLLGLWRQSPQPYIEDPFGHTSAYFQSCFGAIDAGIEVIVSRIGVTSREISN